MHDAMEGEKEEKLVEFEDKVENTENKKTQTHVRFFFVQEWKQKMSREKKKSLVAGT